jgi:hypothetical protein
MRGDGGRMANLPEEDGVFPVRHVYRPVEIKRQFLTRYKEITVEWIVREDDLQQYLGM